MNEEKNLEEKLEESAAEENVEATEESKPESEKDEKQLLEEKIENEIKKKKKTKNFIIGAFIASLVLVAASSLIPGLGESGKGGERETLAPIDPSKLHETKDEDFDIMEYEEYLKFDRNIYLDDRYSGVTVSLDASSFKLHGAGVAHLYELIEAIIAGDSDTYNEMVAESVGHYESFTQQQLYDIVITKYSQTDKSENGKNYTEYVYMLEYKIHENNGTYRNTVESDASRPQYIVINNSTGKMLVMDIIDIIYST